MNLFFGVVFVFLDVLFYQLITVQIVFSSLTLIKIYTIIHFVLQTVAYISISLAIVNLIPIPPFDGSRILGYFLPDRIYYKIMQYEQIIFIFVLVALWFGFLSGPLDKMITAVTGVLYWLFSLPFGG